MPPRVAILGAGIGGLAAAHHLFRVAAERGLAVELVVLESSGRPGGVLATEPYEGALLERGPDTLVTHKPAGLALCQRLGLSARIAYPPTGQIDILDRGHLRPLPAGFALVAPTRWPPLFASPLLSWRGKLRAFAEPFLPPRRAPGDTSDESVAAFVKRRFGTELYRRLSEPVVGGITMADIEDLSLAATFPRLAALERELGRVSGAGRRLSKGGAAGGKNSPPPTATLVGGLGQIIDTLVDQLPAGTLRLHRSAARITRGESGFVVELADQTSLTADAVLIATAAHSASALLSELDPSLAAELGRIAYASCATVNLAWARGAVARPPRSHGFFVPRTAGLPVVAVTFVNVKFPERTPKDQVVARVFFGGALHPDAANRSDAELVELSVNTLGPLLGIREPPTWSRVWRHPLAIPQRSVGHTDLVARLLAKLAEQPGLELAGGPLGAYGLPDSIAAGEAAAERLFGWLSD